MVINEQDRRKAEEFARKWKCEHEKIAGTIKPEDREKMLQYFERASDRLSVLHTSDHFVNGIAWRIYTEACMNPEEKFNLNTYQGEAFEKYVQDEMHYTGRGRDIILEALVRRAIDFVIRNPDSSFEGTPTFWNENLRVSLAPYLPRQSMQAA